MLYRFIIITALSFFLIAPGAHGNDKIVVASLESSTPVAGNTLAGLVYAATTGADIVEQSIVLTKDNQLVAYNSLHLGTKTNVATLFPDRARNDGKFYVIDFTLAEIRQLSVLKSSLDLTPEFHIPSFQDILLLHGELEKTLGKKLGLYVEIKHPWFYLKEGQDISQVTLKALKNNGFTNTPERPIYLQCYDPEELQRIHDTLMPAMEINLKLVQLFDTKDGLETQRQGRKGWESYDYGWLFTKLGLKVVSSYADALALTSSTLLSPEGVPLLEDYTLAAQALGMQIHARINGDNQPLTPLLEQLYFTVGVEAVTTGNWDQATAFLQNKHSESVQPTTEQMTEAEDFPLNPVNPNPGNGEDSGETATQF